MGQSKRQKITALFAALLVLSSLQGCGGCRNKEKNPDIIEITGKTPGELPILSQNEIYKTNHPVNVPVAAPVRIYKEGEKTEKPHLSVVSSAPSSARTSNGD